MLASSALNLRLFGTLEARIDNAPLPGLHLCEGERLLAYLTLRHGTPITYHQLAQLFWPSEGIFWWRYGALAKNSSVISPQ